MALKMLGADIKNDDEFLKIIINNGKDSTDHAAVDSVCLNNFGIKATFNYNMSFADLDHELTNNRPVCLGILHRGPEHSPTGGHIICAYDKLDDENYLVMDPYGSIGDGYLGDVENGNAAVYSKRMLIKRWQMNKTNDGWGRIFYP
jgi:hypothetical protein